MRPSANLHFNAALPTNTYFDSSVVEAGIVNDDGLAARQHLVAGRPIYYGDAQYPGGVIKKFPDGRKQLVSVSLSGIISVICNI